MASTSTAKRLVGLAVHALVRDTLARANEAIARDTATGEMSARFDLALKIAGERGFQGTRARDAALAALLRDQLTRVGKHLLSSALEAVSADKDAATAAPPAPSAPSTNGTPGKVSL